MGESPTEKALSPEAKAKSDALRLLAFKPRSVGEMRDRLKLKKHAPDVIEQTVDALVKQGLLDDEKYARLYAHSQIYARPQGKRQLAFDLKRKGLAKDLVARTLEGLGDYDERQAAKDLVAGRFRKMSGVTDRTKKTRLYAFLKRRGFSNDAIFGALSDLFRNDGGLFEE
jgi:regulatory protein